MSKRYDVVVIGGGIVGLSVARELTRQLPRLRLAVLEKEERVGAHQSGHNSGVIHSGVYYKPGSIKARTCVEGAAAMVEFCRGIPHQICGKVIVATTEDELPRLRDLLERGKANGVAGLRMIGRKELHEIEPHATGVAALVVPGTGITDYALVCAKYAELIATQDGEVRTSTKVTGFRQNSGETVVETSQGALETRFVINCAGLFSDEISRLAGEEPEVRNRAVPRRILRPSSGAYLSGAHPDLSGAGSKVSVPGSAFHAADPRDGRRGTERGVRVQARRLPAHGLQPERYGGIADLSRLLAAGVEVLAERGGRVTPSGQQSIVRGGTAEACPRSGGFGPRTRRVGGAGAGDPP
jgi:glycine/D-amino acid oxidase-like deaminating enzyme